MGHVALSEYQQDAHSLGAQEFVSRHGNAFLVHHGHLDTKGKNVTQTLDSDSARTMADAPEPPSERFVVFPITPGGDDEPVSRLMMVGRMPTNDLVIDADTVSEIHAVIRFDGESGFSLQDAGSRNGTYLNGDQVPKQGDGDPVALKTGARVSLGEFHVTFLDGNALFRFVDGMFRLKKTSG